VNASFLLRLRPYLPDADGRFSWVFLNYLRLSGFFDLTSRAAVNQSNFNASELGNVWMPVPPLLEQKQIVERVEAAQSILDSLTHNLETALVRVGRLRQGVLCRAFSGRLVEHQKQ
jgi:type I restriction enzyme S subunit